MPDDFEQKRIIPPGVWRVSRLAVEQCETLHFGIGLGSRCGERSVFHPFSTPYIACFQ